MKAQFLLILKNIERRAGAEEPKFIAHQVLETAPDIIVVLLLKYGKFSFNSTNAFFVISKRKVTVSSQTFQIYPRICLCRITLQHNCIKIKPTRSTNRTAFFRYEANFVWLNVILTCFICMWYLKRNGAAQHHNIMLQNYYVGLLTFSIAKVPRALGQSSSNLCLVKPQLFYEIRVYITQYTLPLD